MEPRGAITVYQYRSFVYCRRCKQTLSRDKFDWCSERKRLYRECRSCRDVSARAILFPVPPDPNERLCRRCRTVKPVSEFGIKRHRPDGLNAWCKSCCIISAKQYYSTNKDVISTKSRRYRAANRELIRERNRSYIEKNKDRKREADRCYRQANQELVRQNQRKYHQENRERLSEKRRAYQARSNELRRERARKDPDRYRWYSHKRRELVRKNGGTLTLEEWKEIKDRYGNRCLACGRTPPSVMIVPDHVIPLSRGGRDDADNIQPLCRSCNAKKYTATIDYRPSADVCR